MSNSRQESGPSGCVANASPIVDIRARAACGVVMLFLPELIPRSVQQLAPEVDEEVLLIQQEALLKLEVRLALRFSCHLARVRALVPCVSP